MQISMLYTFSHSFFMSSDWYVQYFSVIKVAGQKLFIPVTGNIWIYCKYLNESDCLLCEGRTKNNIFYEGQVWRELGNINYEIKLTSRFEGSTIIYLNSFFFFLTLVLNTDPIDLDMCGILFYTCQKFVYHVALQWCQHMSFHYKSYI